MKFNDFGAEPFHLDQQFQGIVLQFLGSHFFDLQKSIDSGLLFGAPCLRLFADPFQFTPVGVLGFFNT